MDILVEPAGFLYWNDSNGVPRKARCALGPAGIGQKKTEGDGITPIGRFPLRRVMFRSDRMSAPQTALPVSPLGKADGWCDDPTSPQYNKPITLPHPASHELLWREDAVYDVIIEIGFNDRPVEPGKGSAVFMHVARPDYGPTQGCVALKLNDLLDLLKACDLETVLEISQ